MVTLFGQPTPQHVNPPPADPPSAIPAATRPVGMLEALEAVYRERAHLVAHLAAYYPSCAGYTDPAAPDWLVVTVQMPEGQATWHIARADVDLFTHVQRYEVPWDGHTTAEKYERLRAATVRLAERRAMNEGDE